jgi:hypothetical protein
MITNISSVINDVNFSIPKQELPIGVLAYSHHKGDYIESGCTCPICGENSLLEFGATFKHLEAEERHCLNRNCRFYLITTNNPESTVTSGYGIRTLEEYENALVDLKVDEFDKADDDYFDCYTNSRIDPREKEEQRFFSLMDARKSLLEPCLLAGQDVSLEAYEKSMNAEERLLLDIARVPFYRQIERYVIAEYGDELGEEILKRVNNRPAA